MLEGHVRKPVLPPRDAQHVLRQVDPDDLAHALGERERLRARPGRDIEEPRVGARVDQARHLAPEMAEREGDRVVDVRKDRVHTRLKRVVGALLARHGTEPSVVGVHPSAASASKKRSGETTSSGSQTPARSTSRAASPRASSAAPAAVASA